MGKRKKKNHRLKCWSMIPLVVILTGVIIVPNGWSEGDDDCVASGSQPVLTLKADCGETYKYGQKLTVTMQGPDFGTAKNKKIEPSSTVDGEAKSYTFTGGADVEWCIKYEKNGRTYTSPVGPEWIPADKLTVKMCKQYSLSVSTYTYTGTNGGTVSPSKGEYCKGEKVPITASPASGYEVLSWEGASGDKVNKVIITMDGDRSITVWFKLTRCAWLKEKIMQWRKELAEFNKELKSVEQKIKNHPAQKKIIDLEKMEKTLTRIKNTIQVIEEAGIFYDVISLGSATTLKALRIAIRDIIINEVVSYYIKDVADVDGAINNCNSQIQELEKQIKYLTDKKDALYDEISILKRDKLKPAELEFNALGCKE